MKEVNCCNFIRLAVEIFILDTEFGNSWKPIRNVVVVVVFLLLLLFLVLFLHHKTVYLLFFFLCCSCVVFFVDAVVVSVNVSSAIIPWRTIMSATNYIL